MKLLIAVVVLAVILFVVMAVLKAKKGEPTGDVKETPRKKALMTEQETAMYNRLKQSLPQHHVFTQVSFGALITAKSRAARNLFDRKIADFVVCDDALQVVATIELDDSSHRNKADSDKRRDELLTGAGYRVLRYKNIPDIDKVKADFAPPQPKEISHG